MWRTIRICFLVLVILGALGGILGLIISIGVVRVAGKNTPATGPSREVEPAASSGAPAVSPQAGGAAAEPEQPDATVAAAAGPGPGAAPVIPQQVPAIPPPPAGVPAVAADGVPVATALSIIDADGGAPLSVLRDGEVVNLASLSTQRFSIKADAGGKVGSVRFAQDGKNDVRTENNAPFTIAGDDFKGKSEPYPLSLGEHTLTATPYTEVDGKGQAGRPLVVHFRVIDAPGEVVALTAGSAKLRGGTLKLQNGPVQAITSWTNAGEAVEWTATPPHGGLYAVKLTYSCDPQEGGGEFELLVGNHRFTGSADSTGGWDKYRTIEVGRLTLPAGQINIRMKATRLREGRSLMNIKEVRIIEAQ